ncbi:Xylulose kinase [Variovorax sp. SRS16]|uniref:FGGY-family carbohydrate kinase n=1 Tax=Variovorax sp. SRS16 TaxID=282217 RepID=UPI00131634BF|nr:FGGY-family carbohydrate kinase [Variovorax sp. SRS16]VTU18613.1 Xylulose kinase [Variovorax sp. SRS16]
MSRVTRHVIGVDIGTQSTKALLVDEAGRILAQASEAYQVDTPEPLWAEQWPEVWMTAVVRCIARVVREAAIDAASVKALCVSSLYGGSGIPVDAEGQPTHPCLIWMDRRAQDEVEWVRGHVDLERLYDITGNGVDSYHGFTKMLWLREKRPDAWQRTRAFLPPNSFVNAQLTGEVAVDHSSAGNIGGVYDMKARRWSAEMLDALGIPASMMPARLVESSETVGGLTAHWAQTLGLPIGLPVIAGGVDAAVATLAAGANRPGSHVAMIGTSMCWGTIRQHADARDGLVSMPHVVGGLRDLYVFGGAITAGASVTWFLDLMQPQQGRATHTADAHAQLEQAARELPPGAQGLLFLPYLMGERSPIWDPRASGAFIGLGLHHRREHLYRAVLEGVACALRHNIEAGSREGQPLDDALVVVGGASRSDLWMQIIADVTGRPVRTIHEEVEASLGAAMLAALGAGLTAAETVGQGWVHLVDRAQPYPDAVARYEALYRNYLAGYPALRPVMHALRG